MDSRSALTIDLVIGKVLVWIAARGRAVELTPEAHRFFYDRYVALAEHCRRHGRVDKARRYQAKAAAHYIPGQDGPYAAAMALPRPQRLVRTDAVSTHRLDGPDDAA